MVNDNEVPVNIGRGVRQGDTISPRLFILVLNAVMSNMDWDQHGINVNGSTLSYIAFVDDVALFARNRNDLLLMMTDLARASRVAGLDINYSKTVYMCNRPFATRTPLICEGQTIQHATSFNYLGMRVSMPMEFDAVINQRIGISWGAFNSYKTLLCRRSYPMKLKARLFNTYVLPAMLYGCEVWPLSNDQLEKIAVAQRRMERAAIGICLLDHIPNERIRKITKFQDAKETAVRRKWSWASKLAANTDGWPLKTTEWRPWTRKRQVGRQRTRWRHDFVHHKSETWMRTAREPDKWKTTMDHHITML